MAISQAISYRLERLILDGGLAPEQKIPSERQLAARNLHLVPNAVKAAAGQHPDLQESVDRVAETHAAAAADAAPGARI